MSARQRAGLPFGRSPGKLLRSLGQRVGMVQRPGAEEASLARYLYLAPLVDFLQAVDSDSLVPQLSAQHLALNDEVPGEAEVASWRHSLPALADALRDPVFATGEVFVELFMPLNGRRCDALLTGRSATGPSAVLVELKRWSFVERCHLPEHVWAGGRNVVHPSVQVRDYVETLQHHHSAFTGGGEPIALHGVAWLHALPLKGDRAGLRDPVVFGHLPLDYPLFMEHEQRLFSAWLAERLVPGPGKPVADRIRDGHALPSPKLLDRLVECIRNQKDWQLLDEQKTAYFSIRHAVQMARAQGEKRVIVVRGGPGTGKSVLAIQLLADAARQHWKVVHATGSKAFQTVLQARTESFALELMKRVHGARTKKALPVAELFATFAQVATLGASETNRLDLLIGDEAHRLWLHRRMKYPNGTVRWLSDRAMIDEIISATRVTALFLDDNQAVRAGEIGSVDLIVARAKALGVPCEVHDLDAQFRCAGSTSYMHWVDGLLDFRHGLDLEWLADRAYEVKLWDDMPAMDAHLRSQRSLGRRCRLLAGFCWRWSNPDAIGRQPHDLSDPRFGGWSGAWIDKSAKELKPLENRYFIWATDDAAYEQVGSIYSVQGFEFDDIGLIWGEDLVWRTDRWVARLEKNKDGTFKRDIAAGGDAEVKLRNVYRVLLTRGMRSTHLFVLDPETRTHLEACLAARPEALRWVQGASLDAFTSGHSGEAPGSRPRSSLAPPMPGGAASDAVVGDSDGVQETRRAVRQFWPTDVAPDHDQPWLSGVPVLDLQAAAGGFSQEWRDLIDPGEAERWVTWTGAPDFHPGDFIAQVRGDSMEPFLLDGDWCLFKPAPIEQAVGRPALVRLAGHGRDGGQFTLKDVQVEFAASEEGDLVRVALSLHSRNPKYPPIHFGAGTQSEVVVLAIVRRVLGQWAR